MKLRVCVHPKSKKPRIIKDEQGKLHIYVKQAPEKGKANLAVIKAMAGYLEVNQAQISIISGFKSKNKLVEVVG